MQETGALQGDGMKICTIVAAVIASALLFLTTPCAVTHDNASRTNEIGFLQPPCALLLGQEREHDRSAIGLAVSLHIPSSQ